MNKIELFRGAQADGEHMGTLKARARCSPHRLHFDYPYARAVGDLVRKAFGDGYGDARFGIVIDNCTVFEGCTLDMEMPPAASRIHFLRSRDLS